MSNAEIGLGYATLSNIKGNLDRLFGPGVWVNWEVETIALELGTHLGGLASEKIHVLQIMQNNPDLFYQDLAFFLHACDVINNKVADFDSLPTPTSLELAYAIIEAKTLGLPDAELKEPDSGITNLVTYLLRQEGYSVPLAPFKFIPKDALEPGQTEEDTEAKKKAIAMYVRKIMNL